MTRHCRNVARFVLVWFALALGAAAASPLVRAQGQQLVCTAAGSFKFVGTDEAGTLRASGGLHDCPLCILSGAPPQRQHLVALLPPADAAPGPVAEHAPGSWRTAPPLPARGPPAHR